MDDLRESLLAAAKDADPVTALARLGGQVAPKLLLQELASLQDGQFATRQARTVGLTERPLGRLARAGVILPVRRGVWRVRGATGDADPAVAAWLACWPVATISHGSAAHRHGFDSAPALPHLTVPLDSRVQLRDAVVHRTGTLGRKDRIVLDGVAYTAAARSVIDAAAGRDTWGALTLLDDAVAAGIKRRWIHQRATALANGRHHGGLIRDATSPAAAAEFRSWLERASGQIYRLAGLPEPAWNHPLRDARGLIGRGDAVWVNSRVVAETEGLRFHTTPRQRHRDAERFNRLLAAGYTTRRFTWRDVVDRPFDVATTVAQALLDNGVDVDLDAIPQTLAVPPVPFVQRREPGS